MVEKCDMNVPGLHIHHSCTMAAAFVDVDVDMYWRPPYPVKSWKVRPESLLLQAGVAVERLIVVLHHASWVIIVSVRCIAGSPHTSEAQP
jgi:hypothetical protein